MSNPYTVTTDEGLTGYTEAGMYLKALMEGEGKHIDFVKWVCCEVLPAIRKNGYYNQGWFQGDSLFKHLETLWNCDEAIKADEVGVIDAKPSYSYQRGLVGIGGNPVIAVRDVGGNVWVSIDDLFRNAPWTGQDPHVETVWELPALTVECKAGGTAQFASFAKLNEFLNGRLEEFSSLADVVGKEDRTVN